MPNGYMQLSDGFTCVAKILEKLPDSCGQSFKNEPAAPPWNTAWWKSFKSSSRFGNSWRFSPRLPEPLSQLGLRCCQHKRITGVSAKGKIRNTTWRRCDFQVVFVWSIARFCLSGKEKSLNLFPPPRPNGTWCLMCRLPLSPCGRWSWSLFLLLNKALAARIQQAVRCFPPLAPSCRRETTVERYLLTSNEHWRGGSFVKEHCASSTLFTIVLIPALSKASALLNR